VVATVAVGEGPWALGHNPQDNKVYCTNSNGGSVTVIDGATNGVIATLTTGNLPWALCYNPQDNKVYCANYFGNSVSVIDGATDSVIATPETWGSLALCYNALNNRVYCGDYGSDRVSVIDGVTNQVLRTIDVGAGPQDVCHNPARNRVYVANFYGSSVSVLRDSGGGVEESFKPQAPSSKPAATVVRGVLFLPAAVGGGRLAGSARLLDISGRKVLDLKPGANDVRALAPGVYFVRTEPSAVSFRLQAVWKVIVSK
jgi:YVTN family beta-propeller protein